jgi:hypothetical protein
MNKQIEIENNDENREKLVDKIVDGWDMDTLVGEMKRRLDDDYKYSDELFQGDWEVEMGDDDE